MASVKENRKWVIYDEYNTIVWEGIAWSPYDAWYAMFDQYEYPKGERSISKAIDSGLWIEKDESQ